MNKADKLLAEFSGKYDVVESVVQVGDREYEILHPKNSDDLITEEDFVRDERLPYWADIWPSSRTLAEWLIEKRFPKAKMLELGCGVGLVTTASLDAGHDVTATDYYEDALLFARANALRNVAREPKTRMVDWREYPDDLGKFDLVVATDVLYERPYPGLIAEALANSLTRNGRAIIADPGRVAAPYLPPECQRRGLEILEKTTRPFVEGKIRQKIDLYTIGRAE